MTSPRFLRRFGKRRNAIALVGVLAVGTLLSVPLLATGLTYSLVTDLGYDDAQLDRALDAHGAWAAARLDATGFPHATEAPVEVYELQRAGEPKLSLLVDWTNGTITRGDGLQPHAVVNLNADAYSHLVRQLERVISGEPVEYGRVAGWLTGLAWNADVTLQGEDAWTNGVYKTRVLAWILKAAAQRTVQG